MIGKGRLSCVESGEVTWSPACCATLWPSQYSSKATGLNDLLGPSPAVIFEVSVNNKCYKEQSEGT